MHILLNIYDGDRKYSALHIQAEPNARGNVVIGLDFAEIPKPLHSNTRKTRDQVETKAARPSTRASRLPKPLIAALLADELRAAEEILVAQLRTWLSKLNPPADADPPIKPESV